MGRKKKTSDAGVAEATDASAQDGAVDAAADAPTEGDVHSDGDATPERGRKAVTLEDVCFGYVQHLEDSGKGTGTVFSYKLELVLAMSELGPKTKASALTPKRVAEFFECDRVMRTKSGVEKAPPTFLKTRRVLRQALVWAAETKLIAKAPLPEESPAS